MSDTLTVSNINYKNISGSTITTSTITGSVLNISTLSFQSTVISLGQSTNQAYNNFTNGSFTAGWASTLSTTASTAGAGLSRVQRVTMSQSGQYQLAVQSSVASYSVVKSSDSGVTWQTLTNGANGLPAGSPAYTSISYSATGQYALAAVNSGGLYVSNNANAATPTFTVAGTGMPYIYLPMEGTLTDVMGNSAATTPGTVPGYTTGIVGTQAVNLANTPGASGSGIRCVRCPWTGSANFTMSFWFNPQQPVSSSYQYIVAAYGSLFAVYITPSSGQLALVIPTGGGLGYQTAVLGPILSTNVWYQVTAIFQTGAACSLYVNNVLYGTYTNVSGVGTATTANVGLGTYDNSLVVPFNGYIDDFRLYNSAVVPSPLLPANWSHTAVSATGQYMLAASSPSGSGGCLFQSADFGKTWTQASALLKGSVWTSLSQSESGQYALATTSAASIQPNLTGLAAYAWSTNGVSWVATSSSNLSGSYFVYGMFDNTMGNSSTPPYSRWAPASITYTTLGNSSGVYTTIQGIGSVQGEWAQIQSSVPLVMYSYQFATGYTNFRLPKSFYIVGSNDGTTWFPIQYANGTTIPSIAANTLVPGTVIVNYSGTQTFGSSNNLATTVYSTSTNSYVYFRLIPLSNYSPSPTVDVIDIGEWYINFVGGLTCTSNYGQTWSNNNFLGTAQSFSAISGDGQYTLTGTGQTAYLIQNYLGLATQSYITVTLPSINANISGAACSNTGQYMVVVTQGTTNNVYYSTNYGSTWTALTVGSSAMTSCVMSVDGTYITVSNATNVYTLNWNGQGFTVALGSAAGAVNQASNAIAIGNQAGQTNQTANSIVLNASGAEVNPYTQGFYVAPIQPAISSLARTFPLLGYGSDNQIVQSATSFSNSQQTVYGEWIQYQLATPSPITSYTLQGRTWTGGSLAHRYPASWIIVGSNDGTNWTLLDTQTGTSGWGTYTLTQAIAPYTYYRMIMTQLSSASSNGSSYTIDIGGWILNNGTPLFGPNANYTVAAGPNNYYNILQFNGSTVCTTTFSWSAINVLNTVGISIGNTIGSNYFPGWAVTPDGYTKGVNFYIGFSALFGPAYEYNASGIAFQGTSTTINTTVLGNTNMAGVLCLMGGSRVGIGSTMPQYTLDVAGTAQINGPIPAAGQPDTAAVVPNSTFAQTWSVVTGLSTSALWNGCAVSATGQYMTVCVYGAASGNNIYYSSNYGTTWTLATGFAANVNYTIISMSSSGQYQLTGINTSGLTGVASVYTSSNYGATWTGTAYSTGNWFRNCMSSTGQYQYILQYISGGGGIWSSSNYGVTFTQTSAIAAPAGTVWNAICCSASGQYVSAGLNSGTIYYSSNYGASWSSSGVASAYWIGMCCSASGQYQTAVVLGGGIWYSNNYGVSWTASNAPTTTWVTPSCSTSGQYQIAVVNSGYNYYSTNYGISWTVSGSKSDNWQYSGMSQNGMYTIACVGGGAVYLSTLTNIGLVTNGRVGIGAAVPESLLTLYGSNIGAIAPTLTGQWKAQHAIYATSAYCLKLGANYTAGVGAYSSIQSTEYYSGTEHPGNLTLQPIGGYVGIGITNPSFPLHIIGNGSSSVNYTGSYYLQPLPTSGQAGATGSGSLNGNIIGIFSYYAIVSAVSINTVYFSSYSDVRIKKNIQSIQYSALPLIEQFRIVSYDHIDKRNKPCGAGVIGQEIEAIFPSCIEKDAKVVPNIYERGIHTLEEDIICIRLISQDGQPVFKTDADILTSKKISLRVVKSDKKEHVIECDLLETDGAVFKVKKWDNYTVDDLIFVYGTEVSDFLTVDKNMLSMLGLKGIQELASQTAQLAAENTQLKSAISALEARLAALEAK